MIHRIVNADPCVSRYLVFGISRRKDVFSEIQYPPSFSLTDYLNLNLNLNLRTRFDEFHPTVNLLLSIYLMLESPNDLLFSITIDTLNKFIHRDFPICRNKNVKNGVKIKLSYVQLVRIFIYFQ